MKMSRVVNLATLLLLLVVAPSAAFRTNEAPSVRHEDTMSARNIECVQHMPLAALRFRGGRTAPSFAAAAPMAGVMAAHGVCLGACGLYVKSSLGMGAAAALLASAGLSVSGSFPAYMAGVHLALLLQAGTASFFGVQTARCALAQLQGAKMCAVAENLLPYAAMSIGSVAALGGLSKFKPKKAKAA
jgi:hypothetical protein